VLADVIRTRIRREGPMTLAAFMRTALYDGTHGYYAARMQRSGRAGDFYTSVDAGSLFGELLATFVARVAAARGDRATPFDLVEAGAGNGRLMRDILDTLAREHPALYTQLRVTLVESSAAARRAQADVLQAHESRHVHSTDTLPSRIDGCVIANELLDAMPAHRVVQTADGLVECLVGLDGDDLVLTTGPLSTTALADYLDAAPPPLPVGHAIDISLDARTWVEAAASALRRGAVLLIDYGDTRAGLVRRRQGSLMAFREHRIANAADGPTTWLSEPGAWDLTTHVDWTMLGAALAARGLETAPAVEQTHFLFELGLADRLPGMGDTSLSAVKRRLSASTLVSPQGLGASHQALVARLGP
jgi:SAM-dependent MidA family methyltransferase